MINKECSRREEFLVFASPYLLEEDIKEVVETIRSGWIGTGPKVLRFEEEFQELVGSQYAIAMNSCTAALYIGLQVAGIDSGDEVITTPMTFAATANVVIHHGATPVFADVDKQTGNISPVEIERKITSRTKMIIPVHLAGRPCEMDKILDIAEKNDLLVMEDAAHALEAFYLGQKIGNIGDMAAFSFYPTKSLTTAEGGMLVTNSSIWAEKARLLRLHGLDADAWKRYSDEGYAHYETIVPGYKFNMSDLQAALGLNQFKRLAENLEHRRKIWEIYDEGLQEIPGLVIPPEVSGPDTIHARHLYTIMVESDEFGLTRDELMSQLKTMNIGTGVHYIGVHLHEFYRRKFGYKPEDFPNATWISERTLSLPLSASMKLSDARYVVNAIQWLFEHR